MPRAVGQFMPLMTFTSYSYVLAFEVGVSGRVNAIVAALVDLVLGLMLIVAIPELLLVLNIPFPRSQHHLVSGAKL